MRWAVAGLLVAGAVTFYALGLERYFSWEYLRGQLDAWQADVERNLPAAVLVFFALYVTITALSLPVATWVSLLGGVLFGRRRGTGVVLLAATTGATLAFLEQPFRAAQPGCSRSFAGRLAALNRGIERDGAFYLFLMRLVPAFPFFLINLGMGLTPMRAWTSRG